MEKFVITPVICADGMPDPWCCKGLCLRLTARWGPAPKRKKNLFIQPRGGSGGVNLEIPSPLEVFHHKQGDGEHGVVLWDPVTDLI